MLSLNGLVVLCISPFVFVRIAQGNWAIAFVDAIAVIVTAFVFRHVYITREVATARISLALFLTSIVLIDIYLMGILIVYWFYPTILAVSYLAPYKTALKINSIAIIVLSIIIYPLVDSTVLAAILINTMLIKMFSYVMLRSIQKNETLLEQLATTDTLTNCGNRRALEEQIKEITNKHNRHPFPLCLIIFDLDHFKLINDNYGHIIGDQVLAEVSEIVMTHTRSFEKTYRYGGEEFIILPLECEPEEAILAANKLRKLIEHHLFSPEKVKVTISLGIAQYKRNESFSDWISRADIALYRAKNTGRNKAILSTE